MLNKSTITVTDEYVEIIVESNKEGSYIRQDKNGIVVNKIK